MKVAVIGVGVMGSAIAERLLDTGVEVHLFDPRSEATGALVCRGASNHASAAEAGRAAAFHILSLNSADVVERAVFGADGLGEAASADTLLIDMSSIDPARTAAFASSLADQAGAAWIDAPLSGGAPAALRGELTLMVGGESEAVERSRPLLDRLAARITHFGPAGAGQTVKLVNQILCALNFLAVAEAVRFAEANGIDAALIPQALAGGRADSRILQEFMAKMARRDFSPTGRIDNMLKDLETAQQSALANRTPLPLTSLATDLHRILVAGGLGAADSAEYMRLFDLGAPRA